MKKVAIIGAAGFLGQQLVPLLCNKRFDVTVITNHNGKMILGKYPINIIYNLKNDFNYNFDVIINLAFPASAKPNEIIKHNNIILDIIQKIKSNSTKIIHTSSLAVFGFKLDHEQILGPIKAHRDFPYIESKIYFENKLVSNFKNNQIDIVRLGNIWGPNSEIWTLKIAKKLFFLDSFCSRNLLGFSNVTEVRNAASYIMYLINNRNANDIHYHHLAEYSHHGWDIFIQGLERILDVHAIYEDINIDYSTNVKTDVKKLLSNISPLSQARNILESRYLGSYLRSYINLMTENRQNKIIQKYGKRKIIKQNNSTVFLNVLTTQKQFINQTIPGWEPPIDINRSMKDVGFWLEDIGY